jgi:hypothetical protein
MRFEIPDDVLAVDHRARLLWRVIETLDLSAFNAGAKSVEGHAGRPLSSTRMLLTLWLYAISVGVGSAREIERRTRGDEAFRWIVGEESVKRIFRARASLCELSNAHMKHHHGVAQVLVRGLEKVTCVALLAGLAANLVQHAAKLLG